MSEARKPVEFHSLKKEEISIDDLIQIAKAIEHTKIDHRGKLSKGEYAWIFTPGKPLKPLAVYKNMTPIMEILQTLGGTVFFEPFKDTDAIAHIHNHPSGKVLPAIEDLNTLLYCFMRNKKLRHVLIAPTKSEKITGFYELTYTGKRSAIQRLIKGNKDMYKNRIMKKNRWLDKHPKVRDKMEVGQLVLSANEYEDLVLVAMKRSSIIAKTRPLPGYRFKNWRFIK